MAGFDLGAVLRNVPNLDTNKREQIQYIDLEALDADKNNFYSVDGIEELASNIELFGLQQPIRVRVNPDKAGRYIVVSGHRRREALKLLVRDGNTKYMQVPCLVETETGSPELEELRLIMANSDSRQLSSAELSAQAERVEELLYKLKEQGVEFPGRMRDHVAEACKVSKSKLARLKVIRDKLAEPHFAEAYKNGELSESTAYTIARQPAEVQAEIYDYKIVRADKQIKYLYDNTVEDFVQKRNKVYARTCKINSDGKCNHQASFLEKINTAPPYTYVPCGNGVKCCGECSELAKCKYSCSHFEGKKAKLKEIKKAEGRKEKEEALQRDSLIVAQIKDYWERFSVALSNSGLDVDTFCAKLKMYYANDHKAYLSGTLDIKSNSNLPYGYVFDFGAAKAIKTAASTLGCSADYLLGLSDSLTASEPAKPKWHHGEPSQCGNYIAEFDGYGVLIVDTAYYNSYTKRWYYSDHDTLAHEELCTGWYPLPEDEHA